MTGASRGTEVFGLDMEWRTSHCSLHFGVQERTFVWRLPLYERVENPLNSLYACSVGPPFEVSERPGLCVRTFGFERSCQSPGVLPGFLLTMETNAMGHCRKTKHYALLP